MSARSHLGIFKARSCHCLSDFGDDERERMHSVRHAFFALLSALALVGQPSARGEEAAKSLSIHDNPRPLADLSFEDAGGAKRHLAELKGRVVLLNLWATWCIPCRREMPTLDRLQQDLGGPQFEVIALSIDRA